MLKFILTPLMGAIIGYFTNWLAIKMLFRPHNPIMLFGKFRLPFTPGLIPKERGRLASKIGQTLSEHVLTGDTLEKAIKSDETEAKVREYIDNFANALAANESTIEDFFGTENIEGLVSFIDFSSLLDQAKDKLPALSGVLRSLPEKNPDINNTLNQLVKKIAEENFGKFIGLFVNYDKIYGNIRDNIADYLDDPKNAVLLADKSKNLLTSLINDRSAVFGKRVCDVISQIPSDTLERVKDSLARLAITAIDKGASALVRNMDIASIVEDKMNEFELPEAEKIILSVVDKELKMITYLGGVLGLIIGVIPLFFG